MSVVDTTRPSGPKYAIDNGRIVSFIQNAPLWTSEKRNSIPSWPPSVASVTCIKPWCCCSGVSASSPQRVVFDMVSMR